MIVCSLDFLRSRIFNIWGGLCRRPFTVLANQIEQLPAFRIHETASLIKRSKATFYYYCNEDLATNPKFIGEKKTFLTFRETIDLLVCINLCLCGSWCSHFVIKGPPPQLKPTIFVMRANLGGFQNFELRHANRCRRFVGWILPPPIRH